MEVVSRVLLVEVLEMNIEMVLKVKIEKVKVVLNKKRRWR